MSAGRGPLPVPDDLEARVALLEAKVSLMADMIRNLSDHAVFVPRGSRGAPRRTSPPRRPEGWRVIQGGDR